MKKITAIMLLVFGMMLVASAAFAAEAAAAPDAARLSFFGVVAAGSAIGIGIAALGTHQGGERVRKRRGCAGAGP
jgi:hypothetical protein